MRVWSGSNTSTRIGLLPKSTGGNNGAAEFRDESFSSVRPLALIPIMILLLPPLRLGEPTKGVDKYDGTVTVVTVLNDSAAEDVRETSLCTLRGLDTTCPGGDSDGVMTVASGDGESVPTVATSEHASVLRG
jgi:hypothetical protein